MKAFGRTLLARVDERLEDILAEATTAATEEGRPELLARLLPLQPAAPFPAGAVETAMTRRPESRAVLLGAVEATAVALCARLKVEADCGTTRANLRELLARGWISSWETVKGAWLAGLPDRGAWVNPGGPPVRLSSGPYLFLHVEAGSPQRNAIRN